VRGVTGGELVGGNHRGVRRRVRVVVHDPGSVGTNSGSGAGRLRAGTPPAHALGEQDAAYLGAGDVDAGRAGRGGQRIQGPHRRPRWIRGGQLAGAVADSPPRWWAGHQGDQLGALGLADAGFAADAGPVTQPVEALGGEAGLVVSLATMSRAITTLPADDPAEALTPAGRRRRPGRPLKSKV
jgi:hypothetical protein